METLNNREYPIRILSLDIDGTILTDEKTITPYTKEMIIRLRQDGVHVVLNSGRPIGGLQSLIDGLDIGAGEYVISNTGSVVTKLGDAAPLRNLHLTLDDFWRIRGRVQVPGVQVMLGTNLDIYIVEKEPNEAVVWEYSVLNLPLHHISEVPPHVEATRITLMGDTDGVGKAFEQSKALTRWYRVHRNETFMSEVVHTESGKGRALLFLADHLGIPHEQVMAVGDGMNDLEMLSMAGFPVAMGNGVDEAKKLARCVIGSNQEDGLARFLEAYFYGDGVAV